MPTTSPFLNVVGSSGSSVSSSRCGSPYACGVAAARTYSQRGVMTPMPNDTWRINQVNGHRGPTAAMKKPRDYGVRNMALLYTRIDSRRAGGNEDQHVSGPRRWGDRH